MDMDMKLESDMETTTEKLVAPFPWFGGKSRVAPIVWQHFGNVPNYVEPFFWSGAVLLSRPHAPSIETVNDRDGFVCNAWRAIQMDPDETAKWADQPNFENDLHARHVWLKNRRVDLTAQLEGNPDYFDAQIAGWWLWGIANWIGGGWCGEKSGPWAVIDGKLIKADTAGKGVSRRRVHLGGAGKGVSRRRVHLSTAGQGVAQSQLHSGFGIFCYFQALQARLRHVRVCCGDWLRVMGPCVTAGNGITGIFLDPPYSHSLRDNDIYACEADIAGNVLQYCLANGDKKALRIALCGYDGEYDLPGWSKQYWRASGGYAHVGNGRGKSNAGKETIWFSPHCLLPRNQGEFDFSAAIYP